MQQPTLYKQNHVEEHNSFILINGKKYIKFNGKLCAIHTFNTNEQKKFGDFKVVDKFDNYDVFDYILPHGAEFFYSNFTPSDRFK